MAHYYAFEIEDPMCEVEFAHLLSLYDNQEWIWEFCESRLAFETQLPPTSNPAPASIPTMVGEFATGETVSMVLYDPDMNVVALLDNTCVEKGVTGFFYWSASNMAHFPAEATIYFWVMTDSLGNRAYGTVEIGDRPVPDVSGYVWDAPTHEHSAVGSFGRYTSGLPSAPDNRQEMDSNSTQLSALRTNTDRVDGLVEDDGAGNDRFTAKALEEAGGGGGPTKEEIRQEMDANSTQLDAIKTNTDRVDGLVEDDGAGNDRFTEKALEEGGSGDSGEAQRLYNIWIQQWTHWKKKLAADMKKFRS